MSNTLSKVSMVKDGGLGALQWEHTIEEERLYLGFACLKLRLDEDNELALGTEEAADGRHDLEHRDEAQVQGGQVQGLWVAQSLLVKVAQVGAVEHCQPLILA